MWQCLLLACAVQHVCGQCWKLETRSADMALCPFSLPFLPYLVPPFSSPFHSLPSFCIHSLSQGPLLQIQLRGLGNIMNFPGRSDPADKLFLVHSELKTTLPVIVLSQKCSDDQVCVVIHIGTVTYQYDISEKRNGVMVSSRPRKCQYGIPSHFQPFMWCFLVLDVDTCCTSHTLCWRNEEQF